jgi:hypothetical protein
VIATPVNPQSSAQAGNEPLTHIVRQATAAHTDRYQPRHQTHEQTRSGEPTDSGPAGQDSGGFFGKLWSGTGGDIGSEHQRPAPAVEHGGSRIDHDGPASVPATIAPDADLGGSSGTSPEWTVPQPRHPAVPQHGLDSRTDPTAASQPTEAPVTQSTEPPVHGPSHLPASEPTAQLAPTTHSTAPRVPNPADGGHESSMQGLSGGLTTPLVSPDPTPAGADPTTHHGADHLAVHH